MKKLYIWRNTLLLNSINLLFFILTLKALAESQEYLEYQDAQKQEPILYDNNYYHNTKALINIVSIDYPQFIINKIQFYNSGSTNVLFKVNDILLFRFSKKNNMQRLHMVANVLEYLNGKTTLQIPKIEYIGKIYPYIGYKEIEGEYFAHSIYKMLTIEERQQLTHDIALFLFELHSSLPYNTRKALKVRERFYINDISKIIDRLQQKEENNNIILLAEEVQRCLENVSIKEDEKAVIHGDLHYSNMAFDTTKKRINGVYDFDLLRISDIHEDFIYFYKKKFYDETFFNGIIQAYQNLSHKKLSTYRIALYTLLQQLYKISKFTTATSSTEKTQIYSTVCHLSKELGFTCSISTSS